MSNQSMDSTLLEVWKTTVEVQQHFTDICLKIRNLAVVTMGALGGAFGFLLRETHENPLAFKNENILLVIAFIAWAGFFFIDKYWYHRLLKGAVDHGRKIEASVANNFSLLGLTNTIGDASPIKIYGWELHTNQKLTLFYYAGFGIVIATMFWNHWFWLPLSLAALLGWLFPKVRN